MDTKAQFVASQVIQHLKDHAGYDSSLALEAVQVSERKWSVLYFLTLTERGQQRKVVVKTCHHYPHQDTLEAAWQDEPLIAHGQHEYDSLTRVYDHFQSRHDPMIQAVRPIAYVRPVNGVVMDYVQAKSYFKTCMMPQRLVIPHAHDRARELVFHAGKWLRTFHELSNSMTQLECPADRCGSPPEAYRTVLEIVAGLQQRGVDPTRWPIWRDAEAAFSKVTADDSVWIHADFVMGNVMVLAGDHILCLDTALDEKDHPYADVGKFLADVQTRRAYTFGWEVLPTRTMVEDVRRQFLEGYFQQSPVDQGALALYEAQYLFIKWEESLEKLDTRSKLAQQLPWVRPILAKVDRNPMFERIIQRRLHHHLNHTG